MSGAVGAFREVQRSLPRTLAAAVARQRNPFWALPGQCPTHWLATDALAPLRSIGSLLSLLAARARAGRPCSAAFRGDLETRDARHHQADTSNHEHRH
jgi:hypothetical protein